MIKKFLHLFGVHIWEKVYTTGVNSYYQCSVCKERRFSSSVCGYQPLNYEWLYGKTDFDSKNPLEGD